ASKPQSSMQAVHDYADLGGRVFMSHWHNIWVGGEQNMASHGMADWETAATFSFAGNPQCVIGGQTKDCPTLVATIDEVNNTMGNLNPLTPQEKALAFMFFDIASCISNIP